MEISQRNELLYKIDAETQMVEKVSSCFLHLIHLGENKAFLKGLCIIIDYMLFYCDADNYLKDQYY